MYAYIQGKVVEINGTYIILENNQIGYLIHTPNPYSFETDHEYKIYLYQHVREEENTLYGFKNIEQKLLFLKLISVKGLGPKVALPFLATGSVEGIIDAIDRENILYLKKFPKIGDKIARQIILDLKGKLVNNNKPIKDEKTDDLIEVLKGFGYKNSDIMKVISKINTNNPLEEQIKEALKLFLK